MFVYSLTIEKTTCTLVLGKLNEREETSPETLLHITFLGYIVAYNVALIYSEHSFQNCNTLLVLV